MKSSLKTVERANNLKLLERKLDNIIRDMEDYSGELKTVNRNISLSYQKLELLVSGERGETKGDALENAVVKIGELNKRRNSIIKQRDSLKRQPDGNNSAVKKQIENLNREIEQVSGKIGELEKHTQALDSLFDRQSGLNVKLSDSKELLGEVKTKISKSRKMGLKTKNSFSGNTLTANVLKNAAENAKGAVKSGFNKVDPLANGINKNDVSDTGMESLRLTRQTVGKGIQGIKTTKRAVKTTTRSIKTAAGTVRNTAQATYKTAVFVKNTAVAVAKFTANAVTHIIAAVFNPIVWIAAAVLIVVVVLSQIVVMLMGANGGGKVGMATGAVGLGNAAEAYAQGAEFFNNSVQSQRDGFDALIDATVYDGDDLPHSDLIYVKITNQGGITEYASAFAAPWQTNYIKGTAWNYPLTTKEILAIAYVKLQKDENTARGTSNQIYSVAYTQEVIDGIVDISVDYNTTVYANQPCIEQDCTTEPYSAEYTAKETEITEKETEITAKEQEIAAAPASERPPLQAELTTLLSELSDLQEELTELEPAPACDRLHNFHAVGLWYYTKDEVMDALGFNDGDKQFVAMTVMGFENNSAIT